MATFNFESEDAKVYGINAAILLYNIKFWILKNKANNVHFHDGHYWTYNSVRAWEELFPFLTKKQIRTALDILLREGVLIQGNYNSIAFDRTRWFAFADEEKWLGCTEQIHLSSGTNPICPQGQLSFATEGKAIPDIKPDNINTDIKQKVFSNENTKKLHSFNWDEIMARWNELASKYKIPILRLWSDTRKKAFTARMADLKTNDINVFFDELEKALHCSLFLQGRKYVDDGNGCYHFENLDRYPSSFDFFTSKQGFAKTIEGNYADKDLLQVWERKHKEQTGAEKEGDTNAEKGGAV